MVLNIILTSLILIILTVILAAYIFRDEKSGDATIIIVFLVTPLAFIEVFLVTIVFLASNTISKRTHKEYYYNIYYRIFNLK